MPLKICLFLLAFGLQFVALAQQPRLILPTRHTDFVNTFDRSPDGKYFLTASDDKTAQIYKATTGELMGTFTGHTAELIRASFNADGSKFLSTADDSVLLVFDVLSGEEILRVKMDDVSDVGSFISNDGKYVVSADFMYLRFYDIETGEELVRFEPEMLFNSIDESPDGRYIVIGTDDDYAIIFDVEEFEVIKHLDPVEGTVITQAKFSEDGKWIVTASDAGEVQVFSALDFSLVQKYEYHSGRVVDVIISDDGKFLMSISEDGSAVVINLETMEGLYRFAPDQGDDIDLGAISPKSTYGAISDGNYIYIFDLATGESVSNIDNYPLYIAFDVEEKYLITDGLESVEYYHVKEGTMAKELKSLTDYYMDLEFAPNSYLLRAKLISDELLDIRTGRTLAMERLWEHFPETVVGHLILESDDGQAMAFVNDAEGKEWEIELNGAKYEDVSDGQFSENGKFVIVVDDEDAMTLYDTRSGKRIWKHRPSDLGDLVFSSTDDYMAFVHSDEDYEVHLVDLKRGKTVMELTLDEDPDYLGFSSDGAYLLLSTWGTSAYVIDTKEARIKRYFHDPQDQVVCLSVSADGQYFFTAGWNGIIRMFEMESGEKIKDFNGHNQHVEAIAVSYDNKYMVSCSWDHKLIVWDVSSGKILYTRLAMELNNDELAMQTGKVDWLVYDQDYHYDGSEAARELIYMVCGLEIIDLSQMKDALYVPGLAERLFSGNAINYPKISELQICGNMPQVEPLDGQGYEYKVTPRNLGVERVDVYVNDKRVKQVTTGQMRWDGSSYLLSLDSNELKRTFLAGIDNSVEVVAIAKQNGNEIKSRGLSVKKKKEVKEEVQPTLYAVMVGVNDYRDDDLDLNFPVKDAEELGDVLELSAKKLLGEDHVKVYHVNSNLSNDAVYSTPEKEGVRKALEDIGKQAKAEDVVLIFFAGHGVMQGEDDKQFTLLTAEATSDRYIGISTKDLMSWLSPDGPHKMLANKSILILDACNSGQMTEELLALARNDDQVRRIKQVEDLKDKSGMFILAASAPNQSAYELPQYGQGLMTYCLLKTLKEDPTILDDKRFLNVQRWFLAAEQELQRLAEQHGLNQQATPFGTTNIRIGQVDEDIRSAIQLNTEKELVICANAFNQIKGFDDMGFKQKLNEAIDSMGLQPDNALALAKQEEAAKYSLSFSYMLNGEQITAKLIVLFNGAIYHTFDYVVGQHEADALMTQMVTDLAELVEG